MPTAFIAGSTGYTGRSVVTECVAAGLRTVAHVRPDSSTLEEWRRRFEVEGAVVDTSPWTPEGMAAAMEAHRPDLVFALLGTTRARGKRDGVSSYEAVDLGLTIRLLDAACTLEPRPLFVYLSAAGAGGRAVNAYMDARVKVEAAIRQRGVDHVIARPSFITGPGREENRPGEEIGAVVADGLLSLVGALGGRKVQDRYRSITGPALAKALVSLALDPASRGVFEADALQQVSRA
jgi:nucleoside-diphosphate-sugar epimerase